MLEPDPLAPEDSFNRAEILKCDNGTVHRNVLENKGQYKCRSQQYVQKIVFLDESERSPCGAPSLDYPCPLIGWFH